MCIGLQVFASFSEHIQWTGGFLFVLIGLWLSLEWVVKLAWFCSPSSVLTAVVQLVMAQSGKDPGCESPQNLSVPLGPVELLIH